MIGKRAIDVGFGRVKGMSLKNCKEFPSLIGNFVQVKYSTGAEEEESRLAIELDKQKYFFGEAARKQTDPIATMEKERIVSNEGKLLALAALGLLQESKYDIVNLVLGLPVAYYDDNTKIRYEYMMKGNHKFNLLHPNGDIYRECNITANEIKILPQPVAGIFDYFLNEDGSDKNENFDEQVIGAIYIGHNTVEMALIDHTDYIEKKSASYPGYGMYSIYEELHNILLNDFGYSPGVEKIESLIQSQTIKIRGEVYDISEHIKRSFKNAGDKILSKAKNLWPEMVALDHIIIGGGVAYFIGKDLQKEIGKQAHIVEEPLWSIASGMKKYANRIWE